MRELVAHTYCDMCIRDGLGKVEANEALTIRLVIDGKPKRLDLCGTTHRDPTWSDIVECAVDDLDAKRPAHPRPSSHTIYCEICRQTVASTRQGHMMHLTRMHSDLPLADRQRLAGFPIVPRPAPRTVRRVADAAAGEYVCPTCRKVFATVQGLRMHLMRAHRLSGDDLHKTIDKAERAHRRDGK